MSEELYTEQRRLRAEYFRLERDLREIKAALAHVNNQIAEVVPVGPVQTTLGFDAPRERGEIPGLSGGKDAWAALAREPIPDDIEVIFHQKPTPRKANPMSGTGHAFHETIVKHLNEAPSATSALLLDALRIQFPDRTAAMLRSQLHMVLKRMMDQQRVRKISRGVYAFIAPEKTVALTRTGFSR
jgi:hypothetical protein